MKLASEMFWKRFTEIAPMLKDKAFKEEKEWRLVSELFGTGFQDIRFGCRPSRSGLRPYLAINIARHQPGNPLFFTDIFIGPTLHPELSRDALRTLLANEQVGWEALRLTSVPFREW